jgi:antitoxin ParD1/3/4
MNICMKGETMASTSLTLGEHWEVFIKNEISSGRYGTASEVVRDALRNLEERKAKLNALRTHLGEGAAQAQAGEFVSQPLGDMLSEFRES